MQRLEVSQQPIYNDLWLPHQFSQHFSIVDRRAQGHGLLKSSANFPMIGEITQIQWLSGIVLFELS